MAGTRRLALAALLTAAWAAAATLGGAHAQKPNLSGNKRRDVYIAGFFPYGRHIPESRVGRGVMPSVMLAVDHINESPNVLRNYMLHMYWNDTECNAAVGVKAFFDMMHGGPHKLMLFGAACTQVTDPIAKASRRWHLTQLSYADTHPMFTSDHFPNFFRVVPSENAFNAPRLRLLQEFNWTRVGTIYQNEPRYSLVHNRLVADLDALNFTVAETQSFASEVAAPLQKLREKDVRIILGNFNETWARRIFCEAYRENMYGRKYQWIIMGTYSEEWWSHEDEDDSNCTAANVATALEGCILTDLLPLSTNGEITVSGITAEEYRLEYDSRRGVEYSRFHGYTYDGVWAVALAIQHVAHRIRHFRKNQTVVDFRYRDPLWERLFLEALKNTSFEGVTGPVRFYDNERKASILLKQFQNGSEVKVGEFNGVTEQLDLTRGHAIQWPHGRHPPKDRTLKVSQVSHVNITIYSLLASAASLGIIMAITFLSINISYRNQRYIKMSSPYLNNLIIIGCMLTYSSVIFLGLDSTLTSVESFPYICTARAWLLMAGFSLAFGSMFSKTWRVHSIFTDVKLNKKVIKDYQLFMVVGVLLVIDLAIMTTWQVTDPFYRETKEMKAYPSPSSEDILIVPKNEHCQSKRMTVFVSTIYAYKGLLMIFGAFLAWETRHVSIPALNDSKYVGMSVYNVVIMCVMGAAISFVLSDKQDASFIIISLFIIFCTTGTLCLVFVPKLIELKRNPQGSIDKRIRATLRPMSKNRRDSIASELEEKIKDAKEFNQKIRKQLLEKDTELQMLVRRLGDEGREILEADAGSMDRLTVPRHDVLMKREAPSGTETTEVSSLCSLNSSQDGEYVNLAMETPGPKKKTTFSTKPPTVATGGTKELKVCAPGQAAPVALRHEKEQLRGHPRSATVDLVESAPSQTILNTDRLHTSALRPEDSEPLLIASSVNAGESNVHFVPESVEEEEDHHDILAEEKSLIEDLLEDRPRLPTPPSSLTKVVSFGDVTNSPLGSMAETILPPPKQFHAKHRHTPSISGSSHAQFAPLPSQHYAPPTQFSQPVAKSSYQSPQYAQAPPSALRRRSSVRSTSSGGSAPISLPVGASERRRTSVPATMMPVAVAHGALQPNVAYTSDNVLRNINNNMISEAVVPQYYYMESDKSDSKEYMRKPTQYHEDPDVINVKMQTQTVDRRSSKCRTTPFLLNGGDLLSGNAPSQTVARDHEKSRERSAQSHRLPYQYSNQYVPADSEAPAYRRPTGDIRSSNVGTVAPIPPLKQQKSALSHVHSTPNVASIRGGIYSNVSSYARHGSKTASSSSITNVSGMCSAVSEGELLDLAILPIFQKLLSERHKSRSGYGASIASCPNISIKCDIVEYL